MNLEQINLSYQPNEDRILLKIGIGSDDADPEKQEILLFITRRLLQLFWPVMTQAMATQITLDRPEAAFASADLVQMEFQEAISTITEGGNFAQPYVEQERVRPLGELPLLLESITFHLRANEPLGLQLIPAGGGNIDLQLPATLLHGLCKLLQDAANEGQWGLTLTMPGSEQFTAQARTLN
jgi:hypothetical protein